MNQRIRAAIHTNYHCILKLIKSTFCQIILTCHSLLLIRHWWTLRHTCSRIIEWHTNWIGTWKTTNITWIWYSTIWHTYIYTLLDFDIQKLWWTRINTYLWTVYNIVIGAVWNVLNTIIYPINYLVRNALAFIYTWGIINF